MKRGNKIKSTVNDLDIVAVKALRLSIFEVVIGLSNIHGLTLPSICCSSACLIIIVSLCRLVFLSN